MIPQPVRTGIQDFLTSTHGMAFHVVDDRPVGGGCIHNAHWIKANNLEFFVKFNRADAFSNFESELAGLLHLRSTQTLRVPWPLAVQKSEGYAFFLMEYIPSAPKNDLFWEQFGTDLAALHANTRPTFGLDEDNFIGALPQYNEARDSWLRFFIEMRLEKQVLMAEQNGYAPQGLRRSFEDLYANLTNLLPKEPPALLHGDLWSGNFMVGPEGDPVIMDPAVYYGHREAEIAFTRMFGGFDSRFYDAYNAASPLAPGWEERIDLFNLYPLMVHLNLFGRSYLGEIQQTLKRFA